MRTVKMLGLAVVAALAAMAFIGAGSASATSLCKIAEAECPEEERHPAGTMLKVSSGEVRFENSSGTPMVICTAEDPWTPASTIHLTTKVTQATSIPVDFASMYFGGCENKFGPTCELQVETLPSGGIEWGSGFDGTLTSEFPKVHSECSYPSPWQTKCTISDESNVKFDLLGSDAELGGPATLVATAQPLLTEAGPSSACSSQYGFGTTEPRFTATYTVEQPAELFVTQE